MAKYSADIEIAVRGGQQLNNTIKSLNRLNNSINVVNRNAKLLEGRGFNVASIENYSRAVSKAERAVRKAAEGTNQERQAITALVGAMELENKARERKNLLIAREIANQRRVVATANAGFGVQGPAMPSFMQGPAVPPGGIPRRSRGSGVGGTGGGGGGSRVGGAISSALIGGGFPLLFGQGPTAAAGGALGGVAGGLLGGGFGFALSIVGTALGDAVTKAEAFDKSLAALNTGLKTTGSTSITTASDVNKLASSLNITTEEAIDLLNTFKQFSDGNTREALAGLFGPVGGAATFEAIAKAGIDEKNALSAIFSLRKEIGNEAAVQLALQLKSVGAAATQSSLLKIILDRSIEISVAQASQVTFTDRLLSIWEGIIAGVAQALSLATRFIAKLQEGTLIKLPFLDQIAAVLGGVTGRTPEEIAGQRGQDLSKQLKAERDRIRRALAEETRAVTLENTLGESGGKGRKGKSNAELAAEAAARLEKQTQERLRALTREAELTRQIGTVKELQFRAEMDGNKELQIRLQGEERIIQIIQTTSQALDGITDERLRQAELGKASTKIDAARQETLFEMERLESERTKAYEEIIADLNLELALKTATTEKAREQLKLEAELAKIRGDKRFTSEQQEEIARRRTEIARPRTDTERLQAEANAVKEELTKLTDPINIITSAAAGIGDAFATSFKGIIDGSMSAREALANFFTSVADMFLDMAAQIIAKMITMAILNQILGVLPGFSGGGGAAAALGSNPNVAAYSGTGIGDIDFSTFSGARANGGPVSGGRMYMVGERGPELFVPGRSGTIVANDKMGGSTNVVVNVDAKGSSVEGNEQGANQLGRVISAAVQSELIKQQRPGGILAR